MKVRAKLQCGNTFVNVNGDTQIRLHAVYANKDGTRAEENKAFSDATPAAEFSMTVTKGKPAADAFVAGQDYYVDFTPVITETQINSIEAEIQAEGLTASRVTPEQIDAMMDRVSYQHAGFEGTTSIIVAAFLDGDFYLGSGHSACVSKTNFCPQIGFKIAHGNAEKAARDKLWELEGYALRNALKKV